MQPSEHLNVIYHKNPDILEIIYQDNSHAATDEYIEVILQYVAILRQEDKLSQPVYILVDISQSGMFSLTYSTTEIGKIMSQLADLSTTYFAYITDNPEEHFLVQRLNFFESARKQDTRRVFRSAERKEAFEWLTSNKL